MFFWDGFLLLLDHTEKWRSQKCNLSFSGKNGKLIFHSNFLICDCNQLLSSFLLFLSPILFFFLSVLFALHCEWLHAICRCNPNDGLLALCNIRRHHHQQQQQTIPSTHTHRHGCHGYHNAPPSCPFAATSFPPPSPFPFPTPQNKVPMMYSATPATVSAATTPATSVPYAATAPANQVCSF